MSIISTPFKEALVALILCLIIGCDRHSTVTPLKRIDIKADCTGLTFNEGGDAVVINFGKHYYKDSCFKPQIVVMDHEFKTVNRTLMAYLSRDEGCSRNRLCPIRYNILDLLLRRESGQTY